MFFVGFIRGGDQPPFFFPQKKPGRLSAREGHHTTKEDQ
ncbi:hypothetical protein GALL_250350 [mine drainage metagenome]|uniref:Uncharacterized protein n=1 Tax=mine drainage metagenome TaxID=410659 RepID=A0A1J5RAZ4_9ZZZZ